MVGAGSASDVPFGYEHSVIQNIRQYPMALTDYGHTFVICFLKMTDLSSLTGSQESIHPRLLSSKVMPLSRIELVWLQRRAMLIPMLADQLIGSSQLTRTLDEDIRSRLGLTRKF